MTRTYPFENRSHMECSIESLQDQILKRHDFETLYFFKLSTSQLHYSHGSNCVSVRCVQFEALVNYNMNDSHGFVSKKTQSHCRKEENASLLLISQFSTEFLKTLILISDHFK